MLKKSRSFDSKIQHNNNPFYTDLSNIMQDSEFRRINTMYFNKWSDIEVFILYIKLYDVIERMVAPGRSKDYIITIIHFMMSHTESRRKLISLFEQFKNDQESFADIVRQYLKTEQPNLLLPSIS